MFRGIFCLSITVSLMTNIALPVLANSTTNVVLPPPQSVQTQNNISSPQTVLAKNTAILISIPQNILVDVGQADDYPLTLPILQDIYSSSGQLLIPANTPINVRVKAYKNGAVLVADSLIVNSQVIPISAISSPIPGQTITKASGQQMARQNSAAIGNLLTSIGGAMGTEISTQQQIGFLGTGIGIIMGLSSPDNVRVVQIPAGTVYTLTVQ